MDQQLRTDAVADGIVVAVAISDVERASQLADDLRGLGLDAFAVAGIAGVVDVEVSDRVFVAIVDDGRASWLRQVTDLLLVRPDVQLVGLVDLESPAELLAAVSAGVAGFVSPTASPEAIARTVGALIDNGSAIPRGLVATLLDEVRRGRGRSVSTVAGTIDVTEREWEILQLLLQRRSTKEIAEMLFVSVGTVRTHISALGRKLGATDREHTIQLLERRQG